MTPEKIALYEIREMIETLPEEDRIRVQAIAMTLRNILTDGPLAMMAFALVGAEQAAK